MRLFIAIELSDQIREALGQVEAHLKYAGADVKWVEKENIHLTLKFLGEVPEKKLDEAKTALDAACVGVRPFGITLKDIGAFPTMAAPRVIWVGLGEGTQESAGLAGRIDETFSKIDFSRETRAFAAHCTIGRVKSGKNRAALAAKMSDGSYQLSAISRQLVTSVTLFQSTLTPKGSMYAKLHTSQLL